MASMMYRAFSLLGIVAVFVAALGGEGVRTASINSAKQGYWTANATFPVLATDSEVRKVANRGYRTDAETALNSFVENAKDFAVSAPKPIATWEFSQSAILSINTANLVSGYAQTFDYSGGAHPNRYYRALNFGLVGGVAKKLVLKDFIKIGEDLEEFATEIIVPELNRMKRARGIDEIVYAVDEKLLNNFVITPSGITWLFGPYDVGAYVEGEYFVKVSWLKLLRELRPNSIVAPWANVAAKDMLTEFHVSWQDSYKLPPGTWVEFQLVSVAEDGLSSLLQKHKLPISQQNQRFSLKWERSRMNRPGQFRIQISIWVETTKLYQNVEPIPVTSEGFKKLQNIALVPVQRVANELKKFVRLHGAVFYREKIALPSGAYIEFRLYKEGEKYPLSIKTFIAKNPPIEFDVTFDMSNWGKGKSYYLEVAIIADGKTYFKSKDKTIVPIEGWESQKELLVIRIPN